MKRSIEITQDGSTTVAIADMRVTYHSRYGAWQESEHVFIKAGFEAACSTFPGELLQVFEMGFGTGLNALLTMQACELQGRAVSYYAIEKFPLVAEEYMQLNYTPASQCMLLHRVEWETEVEISSYFRLHKSVVALGDLQARQQFHVIYFDAFAPSAQPELWTKAIFELMYSLLVDEGILVTYCSKGDVRRAMIAAGFAVEKLQGPPGKREMLRARRFNKLNRITERRSE